MSATYQLELMCSLSPSLLLIVRERVPAQQLMRVTEL